MEKEGGKKRDRWEAGQEKPHAQLRGHLPRKTAARATIWRWAPWFGALIKEVEKNPMKHVRRAP